MLTIKSNKILLILFFAALVLTALFFFSCKKDSRDNGTITETQPDLTTKVSSSVSGFVTDENNAAVNDAAVIVGDANTITDKYGYFKIRNVQVVKDAAVVKVVKTGYFKSIKTYIATENKSAFFRIKLIPKTVAAIIDAASGGSATLTTGLSIALPANAVVNAATNASYTGSVTVIAKWIDPTSNDLNSTMPGDLRGLDKNGFIKLLTTYGMCAVELTGAAGELLQVANNKKATLSFSIPASITGSAPATIPLWYFDEVKGLWKEEGSATKTGNNYVGEVSHFSFWNCDVALNYVQFSCVVVDPSGNPVQNAIVKISVVSNLQNSRSSYTDSSGYTGGAIPNNAQLLVEIFSDYSCTNALFSQNFATVSSNVSLGNITIPVNATASVNGNVIDCNNAPVTNGFIIMKKNDIIFRYPVSNTGTFNFTTTSCNNNTRINIIAEDITSQQAGNPSTLILLAGNNAAGTLSACGNSIAEFINYSVNSTSYSITGPSDSLIQDFRLAPSVAINGNQFPNSAQIEFSQSGIGVNSMQALQYFYSARINELPTSQPALVNITEYGAIGEFIAGNFTCTLIGLPPASLQYNIICNFRIRRRF